MTVEDVSMDEDARRELMSVDMLLLGPREPMVTNTRPCPCCGLVYPWRGTEDELLAHLARIGGLCPSCVNGIIRDERRTVTRMVFTRTITFFFGVKRAH